MVDQQASPTSTGQATSIPRKIARNTLFNSIGRFWGMGVSFVLTPYIIAEIGIELFGIWSLVSVLVGYFGLLDFGIGYAFVKYVAEDKAKVSTESINRVVNTGLLFYLALGLVLVPAVYVSGDQLLGLVQAPPDMHDDVLFVLTLAVLVFCVSSAFSVFEGVITGLQRMEISNAINVVASVPKIAGTVLLLKLGYGLRGLIIAQAMMFLVSGLLLAVAAHHLLPSLRVNPRYFHRRSLRRLMSYGTKIEVSRLAELAGPQTNKLIIGHFAGLGAVTFYELAARIVRMTKSFVLLGAIVPAASELEAQDNWQALHNLYRQGSKFLALVVTPLMLFPIFAAPLMIYSWMGTHYPQAALGIQVLAVGHFVHLLTGIGTAIVRGVGKPEYETRYAVVLAVLSPALSLFLAVRFGFVGVLVATTIALVLSSSYFFYMFHQLLRLQLLSFVRTTYFVPVAASLAAGGIGYGAIWLVQTAIIPSIGSRLLAVGLLLIQGLVFTGTYALVIWQSDYLNLADRRLLRHIIGGVVAPTSVDRDQYLEPLTARES